MRQLYARLVLFLIRPALELRLTATKRDDDFVNDAVRKAMSAPLRERREIRR
jgi:hypothetical protein